MNKYLYSILIISSLAMSCYSQESKFLSVRKIGIEEGVSYLTDIPNNKKYKIIEFGDNVWTITSLWNNMYNDGKSIKRIYGSADWMKTNTGAYGRCERSEKNTYGYIYNGYAIQTGKLCPKGWRVATRIDYINLDKLLDKNENLRNKYSFIVDTTKYDINTPRVIRCIRETKEDE